MRKKTILLFIIGLAVIGLGAYALLARQAAERTARIIADSTPEKPDLSTVHEELRSRILDCEERLKDPAQAVAALGELSRLYHANGYLAAASRCYEGLEQVDAAEGRWFYRPAMILSGYGETEPALERLRTIADRSPGYPPAQLRIGEILLKQGAVDAARDAYRAILKKLPDEPYALLGVARCDFEQERWEAARPTLEKLVAITNYTLGYDLIVTVYERLGQDARAAEIRGRERAWGSFREMVDPWMDDLLYDSYDPYPLSIAVGVAERRPDLPLAFRLLERAIKLDPKRGSLRYQLAMLHVKQKEYTKARAQLEQLTKLAPDFPDGWIHLHEVLKTVGDRAGAEKALNQGLVECPNSPGLHLTRARILEKAGQIDEAIADYRKSIQLQPTEAPAYIGLAVLYFKLGRIDEGREELKAALVAEPQHPLALRTLAIQAIEAGDADAAQNWIERIRLQPRVTSDERKQLEDAFSAKFGRRAP